MPPRNTLLPLITSEHFTEVTEISNGVKNVLAVAIWGAAKPSVASIGL